MYTRNIGAVRNRTYRGLEASSARRRWRGLYPRLPAKFKIGAVRNRTYRGLEVSSARRRWRGLYPRLPAKFKNELP